MFDRIALCGFGLIGSSIARAVRRGNLANPIAAYSRRQSTREECAKLGIVDSLHADPADAVRDADLVIICVHLGAYKDMARAMAPALKAGAIVTDVGSVKEEIVAAARRVMGTQIDQFVPAHPIAGSEHSGVAAAMVNLFVDHNVIITPLAETRAECRSVVEQMWRLTGARIVEMDVDLHDQILGVTSHLPHIIVFALIDYLSRQDKQALHYQFAAGGLYDLTRIASSDARMWSDICLNNKEKLLPVLREYAQSLLQMAEQIEADEGDALIKEFEHAKLARSRVSDYRK